jgi:hypothetical protein
MKVKSDTRSLLISLFTMIEKPFDTKIKAPRSDNGSEFTKEYLYASKRVIHQLTCVDTPQQNFVVERKHQHNLKTA